MSFQQNVNQADGKTALFRIEDGNKFYLHSEFIDKYRGKQPEFGPIGHVIYLRTYSRPLPDGSQEAFWQTCQRVVEGAYSILKNQIKRARSRWSDAEAQVKAQDMYERMFTFKFLPPGRGLWSMGSAIIDKIGGAAANNCGFVSTKDIDQNFSEPFCLLADLSMLGVGMGYDLLGAGRVIIQKPQVTHEPYAVEDTREGWVELLRVILNSYVGIGALPLEVDYSRIRAEGEPLKTFGGVASGYEPLEGLYLSSIRLLDNEIGKPITSTVISDIMNLIGRCVVAGNVRRSSEIAIGSMDDAEFSRLKDPTPKRLLVAAQKALMADNELYQTMLNQAEQAREDRRKYSVLSPEYAEISDLIDASEKAAKAEFFKNPQVAALEKEISELPQEAWRWASNNSVIATSGVSIPKSVTDSTVRNGEPGYLWLDVMRNYGRLKDPPTDVDRDTMGANPCVRSLTMILTKIGEFPIKSLVGKQVDVWNGQFWAPVTPKVTGTNQQIIDVTLSNGTTLGVTLYHKWFVTRDSKSETLRTFDLGLGDTITPFELPDGKVQTLKVTGLALAEIADEVFCFEEPQTHRGTFNGIVTGQCGEQQLHDKELCCLVETFPTKHETLEDFLATLKVAYLYGKIVTLIPTHNEAVNAVMMANRRIGLSMAGIAEMYETLGLQECMRWWESGFDFISDLDKKYSGWMGVPRSIKRTSIKPGGTTPLLVGLEGGMKFPISQHYVRTVRMGRQSPLAAALKEAGYRVEPDRVVPRTVVVYFPIKLKDGVRGDSQVSLWEKAALAAALQYCWSDNMVSATLTFRPDEADDVPRMLEAYSGKFKGVSLLPIKNHDFAQPPYAEITREEYEELSSKLKPLSEVFGKVHDKEDKFCDGDRCVIG